jgi:hypothetical protein
MIKGVMKKMRCKKGRSDAHCGQLQSLQHSSARKTHVCCDLATPTANNWGGVYCTDAQGLVSGEAGTNVFDSWLLCLKALKATPYVSMQYHNHLRAHLCMPMLLKQLPDETSHVWRMCSPEQKVANSALLHLPCQLCGKLQNCRRC